MTEHKPKALIYARVSSERQKKEGHGLDSQEHRCRKYAEAKGYEVEEVFQDSFSGGGDFMRRPGMVALLSYIDKNVHKSYVVIFDDLSRFARDVAAHIKLRNEFDRREVKIECPNFTFEDTPEGELVENIMAAQNQYHRVSNRRQVIQKMKARLEKGYWPFYPPPGYKHKHHPVHGKLLTPDEPNATYIETALEGFATGKFLNQIDVLKYLRQAGFTTGVRGGKISLETVKRMLERPLYAGYVEYPAWGVVRREGHHQPLVEPEMFLKIQHRLSGKSISFTRKDLNEDFPLRGLITCASCKKLLTASWSKGRRSKFPYYRCKTPGCSLVNKSIKRDEIEGGVAEIIRSVRPRQEVMDYAHARAVAIWERKIKEVEATGKAKENELAVVKQEIRTYTDLAGQTKNEGVRSAYEVRLGDLVASQATLEAQVSLSKEKSPDFGTALGEIFAYLKNPYEKWVKGDLKEKRLLVSLIFSDKLSYDRVNGFGTPIFALPLKVFEAINASSHDGCGHPTGKLEPYFEALESFVFSWIPTLSLR